MSERSIEEMMGELEQNREISFAEKSEQIIDNFRHKQLNQLVKIYCAIRVSQKKEGLIDQLIDIAEEDNLRREYDRVVQGINASDMVLRNCFDDETLFERSIQEDLALPTPREFEKAREMDYSALQIQPGWKDNVDFSHAAVKAIERRGGSLSLELFEGIADKLESDQRPRKPYAIFLPNRGTAHYDKTRIKNGYVRSSIQQWQQEHEQLMRDSISDRTKILGLTLNEYLFAQSLSANLGVGMLDMVEGGVIRWSILPGSVMVTRDGEIQGVCAKWKKDEEVLQIVAFIEGGDVPVAPWTAISFEDFGGSNE